MVNSNLNTETLRYADMNLRCKSDFTVEIGQYFIGRRLCIDVILHLSHSYSYIKHLIMQKYLIETSNRRCIYTFLKYHPLYKVAGIHCRITLLNLQGWGGGGESPCPSVHLSICPSVHL